MTKGKSRNIPQSTSYFQLWVDYESIFDVAQGEIDEA
jgi:hypothetical protein